MKNLTIRRRIVVSFAVILALMMVMAAVAYTRLIRIEQLTSSIELEALPALLSDQPFYDSDVLNAALDTSSR